MRRSAVPRAPRLRATIVAILAAAAAALVALAGCAEGTSAGRAVHPSRAVLPVVQVKQFVPATDPASHAVTGTCWTNSITVASPLAYRCFAGNTILDPCFATTQRARTLVCYADPWSAGRPITIDRPLPASAPLRINHPWGVELGNGKRCVAVTGIVSDVGGVPLVYRCLGGGAAGAVSTTRGRQVVRYVAAGSHRALTVPVTVTWQA